MLAKVMNDEVNMLEIAESWTLVMNFTKVCETSKTVWRQVNATVNDKVIMINILISLRNSFLNFF